MIRMVRPSAALRRWLIHPVEGLLAFAAYGVFAILPLPWASRLGGWLGRTVGPRLDVSRRAHRNLSRAMPHLTPAERDMVVRGMWDNLLRVVAEHPHIDAFRFDGPGKRVDLIGAEHVDAARESGKSAIFVSGHMGNWEILPLGTLHRQIPLDVVYRAANNRLVDWLYRRGRKALRGEQIPKGPAGARLLVRALNDGRSLGMLVDQKMNDGIPVPFFGRDAMTAPAAAELALKFGCPLIPARMERLGGARFRMTVYPPLRAEPSGDRHRDVAAIMTEINAQLESWIRQSPEQWLWIHNRWPAEDSDDSGGS